MTKRRPRRKENNMIARLICMTATLAIAASALAPSALAGIKRL
jgi:hypothetical protein